MDFTVDIVGRNHLVGIFTSLPAITQMALKEQVEDITDEAEDLVIQLIEERTNPERSTGRWAQSVQARVVVDGQRITGLITFDGVPYARIQDRGGQTGPHMIYPREAKVLAFYAATGEKVVTRRVSHPGARIPAMNVTRDARRELSARLSMNIKRALVNSIRQNMRARANG
jgi:hypothetical protein